LSTARLRGETDREAVSVLKLTDNPPITHPDGVAVADFQGTWWVAHTKPRQEKALAHELRQRGTSYFLPLVEKLTIIRGRKFTPLSWVCLRLRDRG